jgi:hypothetical protein
VLKRQRKIVAIGSLVVVVGGAAFLCWDWYATHISWPRQIQNELLGAPVVSYEELLSFVGFSHWGQGGWQWRYHLNKPNALLAALCRGQSIDTCHLERHGHPQRSVMTSLVIDHGTLELTEDWL